MIDLKWKPLGMKMKIKKDGYGKDMASVDYWLLNRNKLSDLYRSESYFFTKIVKSCHNILDIGCAAGGGALFSRELNKRLEYIGIDVSKNLISAAAKHFATLPDTKFLLFDGEKIPMQNISIDLVFSFGVFHHLNHWKEMLFEALRVSRKYVLFDMRVWDHDSIVGDDRSYQKLGLGEFEWDGESVIPYNIISFNEISALVNKLNLSGISCKAFGYYQAPTYLAQTLTDRVLMLSILLEKSAEKPTFELLIE